MPPHLESVQVQARNQSWLCHTVLSRGVVSPGGLERERLQGAWAWLSVEAGNFSLKDQC